jgi:hypothetical protein
LAVASGFLRQHQDNPSRNPGFVEINHAHPVYPCLTISGLFDFKKGVKDRSLKIDKKDPQSYNGSAQAGDFHETSDTSVEVLSATRLVGGKE